MGFVENMCNHKDSTINPTDILYNVIMDIIDIGW